MEAENAGITERWIKKHTLLYTAATRHPFTVSIRDGTVDFSSFRRWLGQDYKFVREFVPFTASVLIKASKNSDDGHDMEVLLGGLASLNDEIDWFKKEASKWDVSLSNTMVHRSNHNYCRFMEELMLPEVEYAVGITAFWAIETVYQASFAYCLEEGNRIPPEMQGTCRRWGNEGFGEYCRSLQKIANRCLMKASEELLEKAEVTFLRVVEHEVEFWNMSHGGELLA